MKLFKSLLLASATGLVAVSGASAADLGAKKPSPVEYVRACYNPLWGTSGGFVIPGTQTCLRVFGQARFDYQYRQQFTRTTSPSGFRAGGVIGLDAITPSEIGNVRAFIQLSTMYRTGEQRSGSNQRAGYATVGTMPQIGGDGAFRGAQMEIGITGFIQFAGITAGRTASFFDPFFTPEIIGSTFRSAPGPTNLIAYTAALGNGVTASVSIEDPAIRRQPILNGTPVNPAVNGVLIDYAGLAGNVAPTAVPHIVGALQVDQAWGSAKLAGALTNVRPAFTVGAFGGPGNGAIPSTKYGFAVMGALKINLPMIAAGDNFVITGAYGQGATSYITSNQFGALASGQGVGGAAFDVGDGGFSTADGSFKLTKAWSVAAGFQHFWTPTVSSTVFGSYASFDQPYNPISVRDAFRDGKMWAVGVNTIWTPVRGLAIGLEGAYVMVDPKGRVYDVNKNSNFGGANQVACNNATCVTKSSDGQFLGRLRITRDF
jgi:Porin subfamily